MLGKKEKKEKKSQSFFLYFSLVFANLNFVGSYFPTPCKWSAKHWHVMVTSHSNLMWNHCDEDWVKEHVAGRKEGQPRAQYKWKDSMANKHELEYPFEEYCTKFLVVSGQIHVL